MKMDKDALIKQKFWILLGVFGLLFLICLTVVMINGGGPIDAAKKAYDDAKGAVAKYPSPKNATFLPPWENYGKTFTKHKNEVWKIAWNGDAPGKTLAPGQQPWPGQGGMYNWPEDAGHPLNRVLEYPDSDFPQQLREWYITKDAYGRQFDFLKQQLQSDGSDGTQSGKGQPPSGPLGAVTFRGGYDMVMKPVDFENKRLPDAEECWLAQEDFWVKRELLYVVSNAMTMAARLDPVSDSKGETTKKEEPAAKTEAKEEPPPPAKGEAKEEPPAKEKEAAPAKDLSQQVFRNASWEVTLIFDRDDKGLTRISPKSRIKNIHVSHREQTLGNPAVPIDGAYFRVSQGESGRMFYFQGEKVPWDKERSLGKDDGFPVTINPKQPVELEQVFDRGNTPVSSIDEIRIPYVSNRNANRPLVAVKPKRFGKNEVAAADPTKAAPGAGAMGMPASPSGMSGSASGPPPGMYSGQPGGMGPSGGQGGAGTGTGAQPSTDKTANLEFERDRYLFVTDQSRHLPLAFTLTVDQSHLSEILVALANSRLRFQTTQVEFRREPAGGNPNPAGGPGMPMGGHTPPAGAVPPEAGPMPPPTFPGSRLGPPGMAPSAAMATPTLENPNLVEVTIYGVASLYEKPRDDKK